MNNFWKNKKFWLILFGIIILGLEVFLFFLKPEIKTSKENQGAKENVSGIQGPVSSVYRYDFKKEEYIVDKGGSWQNTDFIRYIYDSAQNSELEKCYYFLYDNYEKKITGGGQRRCNAKLTVTVGENKNCPSQGKDICTLYVYSKDSAGRQGEYKTATYHIDWEKPKIGKIFLAENQNYPILIEKDAVENFRAAVSDNTTLEYCWFYSDEENEGAMRIEDSVAVIKFAFDGGEFHKIFASCADHYDPEREGYLNIASGETAEAIVSVNHPPKISSCRAVPTQGDIKTEFKFQAEVSDPDGDILTYSWDFGDGEKSSELNSSHYYLIPGNYTPEIVVSDGGEEDSCSTAWISVIPK